ncbi:MFS transporter [Dasania marina]|uniref:MFS transporter n=1 Tax=Dasania marina TaxID=471499 RepID=UPI0030DA302B|tara:strand:- start:30405 stop:31586 length:1182 start_codon:yes stop_codon:yes gene_type:complete
MLLYQRIKEDFSLPLGAYAAVWGCGFLSMISMPYLIGGTITGLGFTETQAGLLGTIELLVTAAASMILAPMMKSLPRRNLAITGILLAFVGHSLSVIISDYWTLALMRSIAGIGAGIAVAAGQATIAATADPGKTTARMMIIFAVAVSISLVTYGYVSDLWAHQGVYGFQALWVLAMLPLALLLPKKCPLSEAKKLSTNTKTPLLIASFSVMIVLFYTLVDASVWSFSERKADSLGIAISTVGWVFGISLLLGAFGGGFASWLGNRYGRMLPYILGLTCSAACALAITGAPNIQTYVSAQLAYGFIFTFTMPFLYKISADLDSSGRIIVAASSGAVIGGAIGPSYSAMVISEFGFSAVGYSYSIAATGVLFLVSIIFNYLNTAKNNDNAIMTH